MVSRQRLNEPPQLVCFYLWPVVRSTVPLAQKRIDVIPTVQLEATLYELCLEGQTLQEQLSA